MTIVSCQQCGAGMKKASRAEKSMALQILGVILFIVGGAITMSGVGAILGVPLMLLALFMGYKKKRIMKCGNCGYFFEIA